jgi:capsule biosynthesis phosphatase
MDIYILCGGNGTRLNDYSFPKPLNMICGKPSIYYCLKNLPDAVDTLNFIVAPHLYKYNFEEIITNTFKTKKCIFHKLPYFTRGPIESAWLGIDNTTDNSNNIVFLDNDVIYNFPDDFFQKKNNAFIGYAIDKNDSVAYSFLSLSGDIVTALKEKKRISNLFCCGVYGFKDKNQFRELAKRILNSEYTQEFYMSLLFEKMIENNICIRGVQFNDDVYHIGSLNELERSWDYIDKKPMRVCFDLDNTLVTYPVIVGDYTTVRPISNMIKIVKRLKSEGHTIIIHTARRMATHNHNVGATIKDIGMITLNTLAEFDIPYDEIIFGKPIADIYVDDRAVNPYKNSLSFMGYLGEKENILPINMLPTNAYNDIKVINNLICKTGPINFLSGEMYYYKNIPIDSHIYSFFPKFYKADSTGLYIENIKAIPFYTLYKSSLINETHIAKLFEMIDILHNMPGIAPALSDVKENYVNKLRARFNIKEDYPFNDADKIQSNCLMRIDTYNPRSVPFIHGDLWFSNILVGLDGIIKLIDMRGQVNNKYTTGGDPLYDYAKLYQSILGYDLTLYNDNIDYKYKEHIKSIFEAELYKRNIDVQTLKDITFSLTMGTMHSINSFEKKQRIWTWIKDNFYSE